MIRALASCVVSTPPALATAMVSALGDSANARWLDPCVGDGSLVQAMAGAGVRKERITAIDLERRGGARDRLAKTIRGRDFVAWSLTTRMRFDRIIANPPYLSLDRLKGPLKKAALRVMIPRAGRISAGSNYWYVFLCASISLMKPGGSLCFVLPAAWIYANYASALRDALPGWFARVEIHRSRGRLFGSVQDGCVVLVAQRFGGAGADHIRLEHDSADMLVEALGQTGVHRSTGQAKARLVTIGRNVKPLREVLQIRLGGVTGDAHYFLMTEKRRRELELPVESVRPIVSKARHLLWGVVTRARWRTLRENGERVWLFDPSPRAEEHAAVRKYIAFGESGGCDQSALKIRHREPWYRTPLPRGIDGFMSGMAQVGPWISLRAMPRLAASNTLYVARFLTARTLEEQGAWALSLLTSRTREFLRERGRVYTDGLMKYEPGDLLRAPLFVPRRISGSRGTYLRAIEALLCGDEEECCALADEWFA